MVRHVAFRGLGVVRLLGVDCLFENSFALAGAGVPGRRLIMVNAGDSLERFVDSPLVVRIFFLCVFRCSLVVVIILHRQSPRVPLYFAGLSRLCRCLKREVQLPST